MRPFSKTARTASALVSRASEQGYASVYSRSSSSQYRTAEANPFRSSERVAQRPATQVFEAQARPYFSLDAYASQGSGSVSDAEAAAEIPVFEATQQAFTTSSGLQGTEPVEPPRRCAWHPDHVNSVKLIGIVGEPPEVKQTAAGQVVAVVNLGIPQQRQARRSLSWHTVEFWGYEALQVLQYVTAGMELAVGGRLKKDVWKNADGNTVTVAKVSADYFQIVNQGAGTLAPAAIQLSSAASPAGPKGTQALRQRTGQTQSTGPNRSARISHTLWSANTNLTWVQAAAELAIPPERALAHLVDCVCGGVQTDLTRLASQMQLSKGDMPWLSVEGIKSAVQSAQEAAAAEGRPSELATMRLKPIREALLANPQTAVKVDSQEKNAGAKAGVALTYGQIRLVLADMRSGLGLEAAVTVAPVQLEGLGDASEAVPPF